MTKWIMRICVSVVASYAVYLMSVAGVHTVCDCLR